MSAAEIAALTGLSETIVVDKLGLCRKHIAGPDDHCAAMAAKAARQALERARLDPSQVDLILYHGSQYKEYVAWSAATRVQDLLGATQAAAFEMNGSCAGLAVALKAARAMMRDDHHLRHVLLVTASREHDLVNYQDPDSRFMYSYGAGAGALVLERGHPFNEILGAAAMSDGTLSQMVLVDGGSLSPDDGDAQRFRVSNIEYLRERLKDVWLPNFKQIIQRAVEEESRGYTLKDIQFLAVTHMKRSFHEMLLDDLGLRPDQSVYLEEYGHVQSVDQILALELATQGGLLEDSDLVVLAGAGSGYLWGAAAIRWGQDYEGEHI
jgi:3-oxoacyl-[acyl-carrier-protein] synthase-3